MNGSAFTASSDAIIIARPARFGYDKSNIAQSLVYILKPGDHAGS
jgi:hypothetical protein